MSRTVLIYITLAAIFVLFLLSSSPRDNSGPRRQSRRLKLRSNFPFPFPSPTPDGGRRHDLHQPVAFDPLVADIERRREDREWEKEHFSIPAAPGHEAQPEWEDFMNAEDYINDEARFNVTDRILILFPKIDQNPTDGFVSVDELMEWNLRQAEKEILHRTQRDMDLHDKNRDGLVSLEEYEPPSWAYHPEDGDPSLGWWKAEHFNASDVNGDGFLNLTEFNDFLHPADSKNPNLINWLCKEEIRERDKDKDGKLDFQEFFHGLFDSIRDYNEFDSFADQPNRTLEAAAKNKFTELDKDKDGLLTVEEIKPVINNIHPSERFYAKQQAEHTMSEADTNKDGRLSLSEMIENPYAFYSAIFTDEDDDYPYHDEFR